MAGVNKVKWKITYYNESVSEGIEKWPVKIRAKYLYIVKLIQEHGPNLGAPHTEPMGDGLFEIRARGKEGIARAFFCTIVGKEIIILHEIVKKTQKTPKNELKIARDRLREVKNE